MRATLNPSVSPAAGAAQSPSDPGTRASLYIPSLDGLRAVAIMIVFVAHAKLVSQFPGNFGVTMFFFLSGFLITTLLRIEYNTTNRIHLGNFYLRRVLRIFPPFYLILGTTVVLVWLGVFVGDADPLVVLSQAAHVSNYTLIFHGFQGYPLGMFPYWSLAVEEHFYLVFPLLYIVMRRMLPSARRQALVLAALCLLILIWRMVLVFGFNSSQFRTYIATDTRIDSILLGCILAIYGNPILDRTRLASRMVQIILVPLAIVVLLATFVIPSFAFQETVRYTIQGLALYPIFVTAILHPSWGPIRILNLKWVRYIGLWSYSMYLMHEIIIYNVYAHLRTNRPLQAAAALAVVLILSAGLYYLVERPCATLRRRLARRAETSPVVDRTAPLPEVALAGQ